MFIERMILLQGGEKLIPCQKYLKWENSNSANYPTSAFVSVKLKKWQTLCLLWPLNELHWQSRSSEANSSSAGQEIPRRFLTAFTRALVPTLNQVKPVHAPHPTSWGTISISSFQLRLGLQSGPFPSVSPSKRYAPLLAPHTCHLPTNHTTKTLYFNFNK
jgi:hypothetical protein